MADPFHTGEIRIQNLTGERDAAIMNGHLIARAIPPAAKRFIAGQRYCALGWAGADGDLWADFPVGDEGFASCDDTGVTLTLNLGKAQDGATRTAVPEPRPHDHLGALFIELSTRRRLRVNGRLGSRSGGQLTIEVAEAYPNCPKYIQRREVAPADAPPSREGIGTGDAINDLLASWIAGADTFFVASAYPGGPVDVSHRGGNPGFVELRPDRLRIPDYPGNSMFGTLGNLAVNPRAGLVFIDFAGNRKLRLTGDVTLDLKVADHTGAGGGTGRWWEFTPRRWIIAPLDRAFNWTLVENSPVNP